MQWGKYLFLLLHSTNSKMLSFMKMRSRFVFSVFFKFYFIIFTINEKHFELIIMLIINNNVRMCLFRFTLSRVSKVDRHHQIAQGSFGFWYFNVWNNNKNQRVKLLSVEAIKTSILRLFMVVCLLYEPQPISHFGRSRITNSGPVYPVSIETDFSIIFNIHIVFLMGFRMVVKDFGHWSHISRSESLRLWLSRWRFIALALRNKQPHNLQGTRSNQCSRIWNCSRRSVSRTSWHM